MKIMTSLALLAAAAAMPAIASAETIDFDDVPANTPITTQYAGQGVTFLGLEDGAPVDIAAAPDPDLGAVPSSPNALTNCDNALDFCNGNRADVLRILFDTGASDISLQLNTLGLSSVTFNLYDAADNLLESLVAGPTDGYDLVSFSSSGVYRIDGLQPDDEWAWALDDLTFTLAAVPEPATWAMMIGGMGAVGGSLRRRQRTSVRYA